ncbi:partitioning defective 6 homolog gamma [Carlito syrichta]|uniref:Partitioning defective 6 homolog gamma n=1 Tax=Carlito syrichta TaxID=1868482 RepID=A0A1U7TA52_CARSF|nr:partitioning defective 6 homolog gamma [Carlito syrichta]
MNRSFHKSQTLRFYDCSAVEVKSKFGAEFRRFSLNRHKPGKFEDFYKLVVHTHRISSSEVTIGYADVHGDLLPINNDDNFCKAVSSANPLLRVFIQKREEADHYNFGAGTLSRKKKALVALRDEGLRRRAHLDIGLPHDFRPVSSIIDVDVLPETHRRVRLYRHGCQRPLGFYIRDGASVRVTPHGLEKVPGIFISPAPRVLQNFHPDEADSDEEADVVIEGAPEPPRPARPQHAPSLARVNGTGLAHRLQRDLLLDGAARESNGSIHRLLSSLKADPRHSLVLPQGGVEEHGPAVTL